MPIGMPGWPDLACSTASIANTRIALAMLAWVMVGAATGCSRRSGGAAAAVGEAFALMKWPFGGWIACESLESI
jgi:hypothetical protein